MRSKTQNMGELQRQADQALVKEMQDEKSLHTPNAIQIVDWYHAADRLKRIAEEPFLNLEERQTRLKQVTEDLWQGRVELVIEACRPLTKKSKWAKQSLTY